jgi:alginate O-acetyltransferase complex protein AlgI
MIINLLIVWMLTGFWHGASWNFLLWGLYFGIILVIEKVFLLKKLEKLPAVFSHLYSLILIIFGWLLFYFDSGNGGFTALAEYVPNLFTGGLISNDSLHIFISYLPSLIIAFIACTPLIRKIYDKLSGRKGFVIFECAAVIILLIVCTASLVSEEYNPFLYFKF